MKRVVIGIFCLLLFLAGAGVVLYPTVSNAWNEYQQSRLISQYETKMNEIATEDLQAEWEKAEAFNASLLTRPQWDSLTEAQKAQYDQMLAVYGNGVMGYVEIPSIDCKLPIYHGTEDAVLQFAIGHLEWTSLPVGGESTHCVLSGHTGLPNAKLFTGLENMKEGDIFTLRVLRETLTYEVDRILVVEPENLNEVKIVEGEDYCTLVTCTPYGKNTHRLLVRGHRIENEDEPGVDVAVPDNNGIEPELLVLLVTVPILMVLVLILLIQNRRNKKKEQ